MADHERSPEADGPPPDGAPTHDRSSGEGAPAPDASPRRRFLCESVPTVLGFLVRGLPLPDADPGVDASGEPGRSSPPGCDEEPAPQARDHLDRHATSFQKDNPDFDAFGPSRPE